LELSGENNGNYILVRTTKAIHALEPTTGDIIWGFNLAPQVETSPAVIVGKHIYIADSKAVWALDLESGQPIWRQPLPESRGWVTSATTNIVLVNQRSSDIRAYDATTGDFLWNVSASGGPTHAYVDGNLVYVPDYGIQALDFSTGQTIWVEGSSAIGENYYREGIIYYTSGDDIAAFDVRKRIELWRTSFSSFGFRKIKVEGEYVLVTDADFLYTFNALDGNLIWKKTLDQPTNSLVLGEMIFTIEGFSRILHAFDVKSGTTLGALRISFPRLLLAENQDMVTVGNLLMFSKGKELFAYGE
jgi:outer membrane protein assembly factor BamB